jgi:hypothetical protein
MGVSSNLAPKLPIIMLPPNISILSLLAAIDYAILVFLRLTRIKEPSRSSPLMTVVLSQVLNCSSPGSSTILKEQPM